LRSLPDFMGLITDGFPARICAFPLLGTNKGRPALLVIGLLSLPLGISPAPDMDKIASISQQLLQFSPDALIVVDFEGVILFANATSRALFGYSREQLVGQTIDVLVPDRFRIRHGAHVAGFLRDPTAREMGARIIDLFARRADGSEFPAGIRLAPIHDGEKTFVAAAIRDMTERRAINDALVAAREEADRANMAKTRFLATASHDLRQPLQTIRLLNASLLTLTPETAELHELLRRQESAINSASRMINSLLDITRLESGAIEPHLAPINLISVYGDLKREFEPLALAKGILLEFPESSKIVVSDRILLSQLLQNLIGNALKYTEKGFVKVAETSDSDGLQLCVEDSGGGIPSDKLERIFDEYYQVDQSGAQRSGVGLGLAIVREVSRLLSYSISVSSEVGRGTQVRIRIPLDQIGSDAPPVEDPHPFITAPHTTSTRLILLEDNDAVRAATELFLSLEGYDTQSAASLADAEELLGNLRPGDLLIADYHLNGTLTGFDVLQQVRAQHQWEVPAVLLSGDLQSMMRVVKTSVPRCRFLSKPVDTHALLAAISELSSTEFTR
jgi:PAS domain S-box-containing protein